MYMLVTAEMHYICSGHIHCRISFSLLNSPSKGESLFIQRSYISPYPRNMQMRRSIWETGDLLTVSLMRMAFLTIKYLSGGNGNRKTELFAETDGRTCETPTDGGFLYAPGAWITGRGGIRRLCTTDEARGILNSNRLWQTRTGPRVGKCHLTAERPYCTDLSIQIRKSRRFPREFMQSPHAP